MWQGMWLKPSHHHHPHLISSLVVVWSWRGLAGVSHVMGTLHCHATWPTRHPAQLKEPNEWAQPANSTSTNSHRLIVLQQNISSYIFLPVGLIILPFCLCVSCRALKTLARCWATCSWPQQRRCRLLKVIFGALSTATKCHLVPLYHRKDRHLHIWYLQNPLNKQHCSQGKGINRTSLLRMFKGVQLFISFSHGGKEEVRWLLMWPFIVSALSASLKNSESGWINGNQLASGWRILYEACERFSHNITYMSLKSSDQQPDNQLFTGYYIVFP